VWVVFCLVPSRFVFFFFFFFTKESLNFLKVAQSLYDKSMYEEEK